MCVHACTTICAVKRPEKVLSPRQRCTRKYVRVCASECDCVFVHSHTREMTMTIDEARFSHSPIECQDQRSQPDSGSKKRVKLTVDG